MSVITATEATIATADTKPKPALTSGPWYLRALSASVTIVISLVAVLMVFIAVGAKTSPSGQREVFGHPVMTIVSGSMNPVIRTGDLVVDEQVSAAQADHLHVGQIISFRAQPGSVQIITHRIVAVRTENGAVYYVTKGDANNSADSSLRPASDVIGIYRFSIPRGGYALVALHTPRIIILLLTSVVLWIVAGVLFKVASRMENS